LRQITEGFVRDLRDEAKRHRIRARSLERALIRSELAIAANISADAIPPTLIDTLFVDAACRVQGVAEAIRNLKL
jgi:hypothetical protein